MAVLECVLIDDAFWAELPEVLHTKHLTQITRRGAQTVFIWLARGILPGHRIAGSWIVYKEVFQHRLESPNEPYTLPVELLARYGEDLSIADQALLIGRSKKTVYLWLRLGHLPARRLGPSWLIYKTPFVELLEATSNQETASQTSADETPEEHASVGDDETPDSSGS
jgi:hypothetical protein